MLSMVIDHALKDSKLKDNIIRLSFFSFQGIFGAIVINDILRLLFGDFKYKAYLEASLAGLVIAAPFVHPRLIVTKERTNNFAMGAGMLVGTAFSYYSEHKKGKQLLMIPDSDMYGDDNEDRDHGAVDQHRHPSPPIYAQKAHSSQPIIKSKEHLKATHRALQHKNVDPNLILGGVLEPPMRGDDGKH